MLKAPLIFSWLGFVAASFIRNRGFLLAASLCYTTVLSLVPFLAVAFSVAKGFGIYEAPFLREVLMRLMAEKADVVDAVLGYIQNTNVKALGFIGVATLFVTSVGLLSTMEEAFNIIWHAKSRRGIWSRFSNYVTVILVCPVFLLAAFSVAATLQSAAMAQWLNDIELVHAAFSILFKAVPVFMIAVSLFILYKFLPSARVKALPAMTGAVVAGVAWQSAQAIYIEYQIGMTGYNAIYGSFAQIPLLLVWLYISWLIVLAGAEIANAAQNFSRIRLEDTVKNYSFADRRDLAVLLALMLTGRAENKEPPLGDLEAADILSAPAKLIDQELKRLGRAGIAVRAVHDGEGTRWVLAASPDRITVGELVTAWEALRGEPAPEELAGRYPVLAGVKDRLHASCLEGSAQTLREVWLKSLERE